MIPRRRWGFQEGFVLTLVNFDTNGKSLCLTVSMCFFIAGRRIAS